jgi:hypothetical protein
VTGGPEGVTDAGPPAGLGDAAQRVAGLLAAQHRGDTAGTAELLRSFPDEGALAGGALLLADLLLGLYAEQTGQDRTTCTQELVVQIERAIGSPPS